jgi:opacity protein-like surface antigen
MKTAFLALGSFFFCATHLHASNWYLHTDVGGTMVEDVKIKGAAGSIATFAPGVGGTVSLGYHFTPVLAGEFETGALWNEFDTLARISLRDMQADAQLYQIPLKLNLVLNLPTKSRWTPYLGGGAGGMISILESRLHPISPARATLFPIGNSNFSDTDVTFCYQALAGIKYRISAHAAVDIGYKFFGTLDHSWSSGGSSFDTEPIYTHAFLASFTWRF